MRSAERRIVFVCTGAALLAVSAVGLVHGARVATAQAMYWQCKFGNVKDYPPSATFRRCEDAYRLYPHNYYFSIWTSELAYYRRFDDLGAEIPEHLNMARLWCDRGLEMNPYRSQLRVLKTRLLDRESVAEAIRYWESCVDWNFWDPYNHAILVDLYAKAGDFFKALSSLEWVKGSPYGDEAKRKVAEAWRKEMQASAKSEAPSHQK